jgi:probable rRNA maturation factor
MLKISFQTKILQWKKILLKFRKDFSHALETAFDAVELPNRKFTVSVSLVDDIEMQRLNKQYRNKDKPTDVLSFPLIEDFSDFSFLPEAIEIELGDIVLAYETVEREATEQGKLLQHHITHLLIHGLLHLFGYDHMDKKDAAEMEKLEISILKDLKIKNPYL